MFEKDMFGWLQVSRMEAQSSLSPVGSGHMIRERWKADGELGGE